MADDTELDPGSGGDTFRTLEDVTAVKWPVGVVAYVSTLGTPDVLNVVRLADGLPVQPQTASTWAVTQSGSWTVSISGTVPVSGTIAASQSGTWTVQPGNTANTTAWLVTGTGGTFPVTDSAGSLTVDAPVGTPVFVRLSDGTSPITTLPVSLASVPSHAVTNAGVFAVQVDNTVTVASHAVTNAGTFAVQATQSGTWTVQPGNTANTTAWLVTGTGGTFPVTGTVTANAGSGTFTVGDGGGSLTVDNAGTFAVQAAQTGTWTIQPGNTANTTAWLVTGTGGTFPITDSGGSLTVDAPVGTPVFVRLSDGSSAIATLPVSLASVPSHAVTNAGTFAVQVDGSALTSLQLIDDPILADDAAFTLGSSKVMMFGAIRDDSLSTLSAAEGDAVPLRVSSTGAMHVTGGGGGTEYTEDAAAAADPVGSMMMAVRRDTLSASEVSADGDNVALKATSKGQLRTDHSRPALGFGTKSVSNTPTQLSASSVPCSWILLQSYDAADVAVGLDNTVNYAALSNSAAKGIILTDRQTLYLEIDDLNKIWMDAAATTTIVTYIYG